MGDRRDTTVARFCDITSSSREDAKRFLESANGSLEGAIVIFFAAGGSPETAGSMTPAPIPLAGAEARAGGRAAGGGAAGGGAAGGGGCPVASAPGARGDGGPGAGGGAPGEVGPEGADAPVAGGW